MRIFLSEIAKITERKQFWVILVLLSAVVFGDFFLTIQHDKGCGLSQISSAYDRIIINNTSEASVGDLFFRGFPFFLITSITGADVFYEEKEKRLHYDIFTRISSGKYIRCQALAVMTVTFLTVVFVIMLSQCLALTAFPVQGFDMDGKTAYNTLLPVKDSVLSDLRAVNPYLNNLAYALIWGILGASFALLSYALSFVHQLKRYVILILPALIYQIYTIVTMQMPFGTGCRLWDTYLLIENSTGTIWSYAVVIFAVCGSSFFLIWRGLHNDKELL